MTESATLTVRTYAVVSSSDGESVHVLSDDDEVVNGNLVREGPDSGSSDSTTNWREAYFALNTAFKEVKGRYKKTQQQAADLQKRMKRLEKKDSKGLGNKEKENLRTNIFALQLQITKLQRKNGFLEAKLKSHLKHKSEVQRFPESESLVLELMAANTEIEELRQQLLRRKSNEGDQTGSEAVQEELAQKLEKGFAAYNEKYQECEELRKKVEQLEQSLNIAGSAVEGQFKEDLDSGCIEPVDVATQTKHTDEEILVSIAEKVETDRRDVVEKELGEKHKEDDKLRDYLNQILGLEVMKNGESYAVLLTDRDKLQQWLTSSTFGNIRIRADALDSRDSSTETHDVVKKDISAQVSLELEQDDTNNSGAREILLKQKIQDQASHIERLHRMMTDISEQRDLQQRENDQAEQKSQKQAAVEDKGVGTDEDPLILDLTQTMSDEDPKHIFTRFGEVVGAAKQLQKELEQQKNCVKELAGVTSKYRELKKVALATSRDKLSPNEQETWLKRQAMKESPDKDTETTDGGARPKENLKQKNTTGHAHAPLTVPVQETNKPRRPAGGASAQSILQDENEEKFRIPERHSLNEASMSAEGGLYTESDIEALGEDDTDYAGVVALQGRVCPICSESFSMAVSQEVFEHHVQCHFESDEDSLQ